MEKDLKADAGTEAAIREHQRLADELFAEGDIAGMIAMYAPEIMAAGD
jgi:hypothetical protein